MPLNEYQKKRDFKKTPEPAGNNDVPSAKRLYVIQKHAASRLHYDLRLELGGVLKSWAVPKGPSLNPDEKRLAVHVEDHPIEYGTFEGIIPPGEYGGGTVMLWDKGTWIPEEDPEEAYGKGRLHFQISGEKLHGRWVLFKIGDDKPGNGKNWLLVKSKDAFANKYPEDHLLSQNRSISTGRTMDEIASAEKTAGPAETRFSPSVLTNARETDMPSEIRPQLPTLVDTPPTGDQWIHEIKYDGYRIMAFLENGMIRLSSRNGKDWTDRFQPIAEALSGFPADKAIIDGEVVIQFPDGTTSFQALQNALLGVKSGTWVYYLFDILYHDGYDLSDAPLIERKNYLKQLLEKIKPDSSIIRYSDHVEGSGDKVYEHACRLSLEGVISKGSQDAYQQKRTRRWMKVKCGHRQEFVIGGYTEPSGSRTGFGALLLGVYDDREKLRYCGKVGTGFNENDLVSLWKTMSGLERETPSYVDPPRGAEARNVHWLTPVLVAEIEFSGWTEAHSLRHPVFKGLREDKEARNIRRETVLPKHAAPAGEQPESQTGSNHKSQHSSPDRKRNGPSNVKGHNTRPQGGTEDTVRFKDVRLTNAGRILYPEQGVSKADLARYYERVSDHILPHVTHRPLSLVRCPRGRGGDCFYQKHFPESLPDFVRGIQIKEKKSTETYIVIDDVRGLISLTQIGVLEIHLWNAREDRIERPDLMILDIDPAPGLELATVKKDTRLLHGFLNDIGLRNFLKTSGGKGFHVVVPLVGRSDWEEIKAFAGAIARQMTLAYPDRFIDTMSKKKREGKIFIDYFRNTRGATSIAPYSTRARPGAPVSAPITWEELTETAPDAYRIDNIDSRIHTLETGKDPWKDFYDSAQSITKTMKTRVGL